MDRECAFPGCDFVLVDPPKNLKYCVLHQLMLRDMQQRDRQFILDHPKGCTAEELCDHAKFPMYKMYAMLRKKRLEGCKILVGPRAKAWWVSSGSMVEVIDITTNWVVVNQKLATRAQADRQTLFTYVKAGEIGETNHDLDGRLMIRREELPTLAEKYRKIKLAKIKRRGILRLYLRSGEITPGVVAKKLMCSEAAIYHRMAEGHLKYTLKSAGKINRYAISVTDFWQFIQDVINGKYKSVRPEFRERCYRAIEERDASIPSFFKKVREI